MYERKNIVIVLLIIIILASAIEVTRTEFIIRLNRNKNFDLLDSQQAVGSQIDKNLIKNITSEKYLIIYDAQLEEVSRLKENFEKTFDYIRKDYDAVRVDEVNIINPQYKTVILIVEDLNKLKNINSLLTYVFEGGNVFFGFRLSLSNCSIYRKLGIYEYGNFIDSTGISLLDNVLIKGEGFKITEKDFMTNSSISLNITDDCEKYAESMEGTPLLWKKKYGQGDIIYFNGTMLAEKSSRGFIVGSLSLLEDDFIYPIINTKVCFIDDFPSPIPEGNHEKITREFRRSISQFYKDVWWPDMLELATHYNMKYTGGVIGTYNNEVANIMPGSTELDVKDFIYYGRELINHGGELGIHGYNHQPFFIKYLSDNSISYKPWKNIDAMIESIKEIDRLCKSTFPKYLFRVYVPPGNILSPEGREALLISSKDIRIISSIYSTAGNNETHEQEFEISSDGMIEFPRLTFGYLNTSINVWDTLNGITSHGVCSHFVQPYDILDTNYTGDKGWTQLLEEYDEYNKMIFDNYEWLRGMTASEGANEMIKYLSSEPRYEKKDEYIKIYYDNLIDKIYFILRTEKEIASGENCDIKNIDKNTYLIEINTPICQINFKR